MECSSPLVRFCRYMNVPIASAQDHGGSPKPRDIAQVLLVATLFGEGEYGTDEMIRMSCLLQSPFIRPLPAPSQSPFIRPLPAPSHGRTSPF